MRRRLFALVLGGAAFLAVMGELATVIAPPQINVRLIDEVRRHRAHPAQRPYITLGPSHARAVSPEALGAPVLKLWTNGQSFAGSVRLAEILTEDLSRSRGVLRLVSMTGLALNPRSGEVVKRLTRIEHALLRLEGMRGVAEQLPQAPDRLARAMVLPVAREDNWRQVGVRILRALAPGAFPNGPIWFRETRADSAPFDPEMTRRRVHAHLVRLMAEGPDHRAMRPGLHDLLRLIAATERARTCLVLVNSPVSSAYETAVLDARPDLVHWRDTLRAEIAEVRRRGACVHFLDGLWSREEATNPRYYADSDHLNEVGGRLFTTRLATRLDALQVEPPVPGAAPQDRE